MAKEKKPRPDKYNDKVTTGGNGFHETMKLLAHHANTKGTVNVTYKNRNSAK